MKVKIPFHDRFVLDMGDGRKTATTRSKRYGVIGDTFWIKGICYRIYGVVKWELGKVARMFYKQEGFKSPKEFKEFWLTIHRTWQPKKKYYLHIFGRCDGN